MNSALAFDYTMFEYLRSLSGIARTQLNQGARKRPCEKCISAEAAEQLFCAPSTTWYAGAISLRLLDKALAVGLLIVPGYHVFPD